MFSTVAMHPLYYDKDQKAVFSTDQIEQYGLPEYYGYEGNYIVVEAPPYLQPTFFDEVKICHHDGEKPVHRYDRMERFRTCLQQLLGIRGVIGKSAFDIDDIMREEIYNYERQYMPPCLVWNRLRKVFSKHKKSKFCNRIPRIAKAGGFAVDIPVISRRMYNVLCEDFKTMHNIFPHIRHLLKRKYFPSIRAMCLLLMERYKIPNVFMIPIAHTKHKSVELRETFEIFWQEINNEMSNLIFD